MSFVNCCETQYPLRYVYHYWVAIAVFVLCVQWIFGMPMNQSMQYTSEEVKFAKIIMSYWTNFAKTG